MKIPQVSMVCPGAGERYKSSLALMSIAERMTHYGFRVDRDRIRVHADAARERSARFSREFLRRSGLRAEALGKAGAGQTDGVKAYFRKLGAPDVEFDKRTKRPQFNTAALTTWATSYKREKFAPLAALLIGIRKNIKSQEFCRAYECFSRADGRIHFQFNILGTVTGRWTSSTKMRLVEDNQRTTVSCNAQQIPTRVPSFDFGNGPEPLVASLRDIFVPDPGSVLLKADYDQLELRLIAYTYGVKELLRIIDLGDKADAHCFTAAHLFESLKLDPYGLKPSNKQSKEAMAREAAKACAYGASYQMHSARGIYPQLTKTLKSIFPDITERKVAHMAERFFQIYPEILEGQMRQKAAVDNRGYAELSIDGRRLYYPPTMRGYNQALNFPMQGTGGALCNRALLEIDPQLDWNAGCQVRAQVHDELVIQAPYERASEVAALVSKAMARPAQIGTTFAGIPAEADPGLDWGSCKKWSKFALAHPNLLA